MKAIKDEHASIACEKCGQEGSFKEWTSTRPIEGYPDITEHGLKCPECGNWAHGYFMSTKLENQRISLKLLRKTLSDPRTTKQRVQDYHNKLNLYKQEYRRLHRYLYARLDIKPPKLTAQVGL